MKIIVEANVHIFKRILFWAKFDRSVAICNIREILDEEEPNLYEIREALIGEAVEKLQDDNLIDDTAEITRPYVTVMEG